MVVGTKFKCTARERDTGYDNRGQFVTSEICDVTRLWLYSISWKDFLSSRVDNEFHAI